MLFIVDKKIVVEIVKLEKYFDKFCWIVLYFDNNFLKIGFEEFVVKFEFEKEKIYFFVMNIVSSVKKLYEFIN